MKYRDFGATGFSVSEVTLGTMRLSADAAHVPSQLRATGEAADQANVEARHVLNAALDAGINCLHSSEDYGTWWLMGEVLAQRADRHDIHHVIKMTTPDYSETAFDGGLVRRSVESALKALHAERITFVQHLQRGPDVTPAEAYSETGDSRRVSFLEDNRDAMQNAFDELSREGKMGAVLSFPHTMGYARVAIDAQLYEGVVHFLNLLETEILPLLSELDSRSLGLFALRPLLQGMLTDSRADRVGLAAGDPAQLPIWDTRYEVLNRVRQVAEPTDSTWSSFATRFALSFPTVSSVISSARTMRQLHELLEAPQGSHLDAITLQRIRAESSVADRFSKFDLFPENQVAQAREQ